MRPKGRGLIPGKQLQGKPNRTQLTGQGWTYRFRIKSLDFLFILIDSGLYFIMFGYKKSLEVLCSHTISNAFCK